jgi:drug/metabolite transporter (DMT)-like permease
LIFSIIVGFFGIVLILRPTVEPALFMAMLLGIAVGITGAWTDWMIRMLSERGEPPYRIVFYFLSAGTIVAAVATVMTGGFHPIDWRGFVLLFLIGVLGTLEQFTLTHAWKYGVPLINTLYQYSGVVFAVILGMLAFDDEFDWVTLLGIAIVCLSGVAASLPTLRLAKNKLNSFKRLGRIEKSGKR